MNNLDVRWVAGLVRPLRVKPGSEVRLVDGDRIRLAADVTGDVSLPRGEPDPASLSRNGFV